MKKIDQIWIIGMGRLGTEMFKIWKNENININLVDKSEDKLSAYKNLNIGLIVSNLEIYENIKELDIKKDDVFVVTVGEDFKSSILICQNLLDIGANAINIFVRAQDKRHEKIIKLLGIKNTFHPFLETSKNISFNVLQNSPLFFQKNEYNIFLLTNDKIDKEKIKDINIGEETKFLLVTSGEETKIAVGSTVIKKGDEILVLAKKQHINAIKNKFSN